MPYPTHYQAYAPPVSAAATSQAKPATTYSSTYNTGGSTANPSNPGAMDSSDIASLNDALGSAGVDLRVAFIQYMPLVFLPLMLFPLRPKKNLYNIRMPLHLISPAILGRMTIEPESNLSSDPPSTLVSSPPPCVL